MKRACRGLWVLILILATTPLWAQGDFQKGLSYYKQKQYDKAIVEFEPIVEKSPDYEDGHRILGHCYLQVGRFDKAVASFKKAIELKPDNFFSSYGLGLAYFNQHKDAEAATALLKAEQYAKSSRERLQVFRTRGAAYFNRGQYARAVADLERAQGIGRGGKDEILQLGLAYYKLQNPTKAQKYLEQVRALDPTNRQANKVLDSLDYQLALEALKRKSYSSAAALLRAYVKDHPQDGAAWYNLGLAHLGAKDYSDAESAFVESRKLRGDKWETLNRLGFLYEVTKRYSKALDAYQTAYRLNSSAELKESVSRIKKRLRRQRAG